jgi:hypothetical protein
MERHLTSLKYRLEGAEGMAFKEAYNALAAKNKLPSFDVLHAEVDLSNCEFEDFPLRQARNAIKERMDGWLDVVEAIVSPDSGNASALYEVGSFGERELKDVFALYSKIMYNYRVLTEAAILMDEKTDAEAIKIVWKEWTDIKKKVAALATKLKESWTRELKRADIQGYLG